MKYIHGGWSHFFKHDRHPTEMRICFDKEQNKLVAMELRVPNGMVLPRRDEFFDVEDSLKNGNQEALAAPSDYGLSATCSLPAWAQASVEKGAFYDPEDDESTESDFDNKQALSEGWDLFDCDGRIQLQRIDCPSDHEHLGLDYDAPKFASDADALIFVALQANVGSTYHRDAIERIGSLAKYE